MDQHPIQGGVAILLVASCYRNRAIRVGHSGSCVTLHCTFLSFKNQHIINKGSLITFNLSFTSFQVFLYLTVPLCQYYCLNNN